MSGRQGSQALKIVVFDDVYNDNEILACLVILNSIGLTRKQSSLRKLQLSKGVSIYGKPGCKQTGYTLRPVR
jgi:hypothetical protein